MQLAVNIRPEFGDWVLPSATDAGLQRLKVREQVTESLREVRS